MEKEHLAEVMPAKRLQLDCPEPDFTDWEAHGQDALTSSRDKDVTVALVGKYTSHFTTLISVLWRR